VVVLRPGERAKEVARQAGVAPASLLDDGSRAVQALGWTNLVDPPQSLRDLGEPPIEPLDDGRRDELVLEPKW
jgi:hypothetical protein